MATPIDMSWAMNEWYNEIWEKLDWQVGKKHYGFLHMNPNDNHMLISMNDTGSRDAVLQIGKKFYTWGGTIDLTQDLATQMNQLT